MAVHMHVDRKNSIIKKKTPAGGGFLLIIWQVRRVVRIKSDQARELTYDEANEWESIRGMKAK